MGNVMAACGAGAGWKMDGIGNVVGCPDTATVGFDRLPAARLHPGWT